VQQQTVRSTRRLVVATRVERSIVVEVPVRTAYDQWTQFEDFPRFMSGVEQVRQIGDAMTHWVAQIAGVRREWDAAILEQVPDEKVAWAATTGATNAGTVSFEAIGAERTRVRLTLDYEPAGVVERIGEFLKMVERTTVADLDRFKQFIESRGSASGGWRGTVHEGDADDRSGAGVATSAGAAVASTVGAGATRDEVPGDETAPAGDPAARQTGDVAGSTSGGRNVGSRDDDPAGPVVADYPGDRTSHTETGAESPDDDAAGFLTGYPGERTPGHVDTDVDDDDPAASVVAGYPGDRTSHTETGGESPDDDAAGFVTGYPGTRTPSHTGEETDADPRDIDTPDRRGETPS
jgi:uncharacterized membrane protein